MVWSVHPPLSSVISWCTSVEGWPRPTSSKFMASSLFMAWRYISITSLLHWFLCFWIEACIVWANVSGRMCVEIQWCVFPDQRKWGGVGSPSFVHLVWPASVCGGGSQVHTNTCSGTTAQRIHKWEWKKLEISQELRHPISEFISSSSSIRIRRHELLRITFLMRSASLKMSSKLDCDPFSIQLLIHGL